MELKIKEEVLLTVLLKMTNSQITENNPRTTTDRMQVFANWVSRAAHITVPGESFPQKVSVSASVSDVSSGPSTKTMEFCSIKSVS